MGLSVQKSFAAAFGHTDLWCSLANVVLRLERGCGMCSVCDKRVYEALMSGYILGVYDAVVVAGMPAMVGAES